MSAPRSRNAVEQYLYMTETLDARPGPVSREREAAIANRLEELWNRLTETEQAEVNRRLIKSN